MNKIFKVIWNEARNAYVVVSEIAKNHGSKSCSTKKLLAMLIATGVMTCASFDVLAEKPAAEKTAAQQYVALKAADFPTSGPSWRKDTWGGLGTYSEARDEWKAQQDGTKQIGKYTYTYDETNKYWVREGYVLTVDKNGGKYTPLSQKDVRADVAYTGTVYGKNNEILMTVKDNGKFYSYWAASVTDPSATMETYPVSKYNSDLAVIDKNIKDLNKDIIKEVTLTKGDDSAIIRLVRNGGNAVDGAITVTSGGGTGGSDAAHDTFVKISNGTTEQTFATGSKVEAIGSKDATTGIKINGEDYTIKSGSKVSVAQNDKTTTITVDGKATVITDTDTKYTKGNGIAIDKANAISVKLNKDEKNLVVDGSGLALNTALTGIQSITGEGEGAGSISFADGGKVKVNDVIIEKGGKITGVAAGTADTDAVNYGQLKDVKAEAGKHTTLSNGKNTTVESTVKDGQTDYKVNVAGDLTDITSVANGDSKINLNKDSIIISNGNKYFAITNSGIGMSYIGADYSAKSIMLGENGTTISGGLNVAGSKITGVAAGVADTDAVNVGQLKEAVQAGNTDTHIKPGEYGVGADNKVNMDVVDKNGNKVDTVTIKDVAKASDVGDVSKIADDLKNGGNKPTTVVDAVNNLNNKVGDLNYVEGGKGNYVTNGETTTTSIGKLDKALKDVADTAAKQHTTVSGSGNIVVEDPTTNTDGGKNYNVKLADNITVNSVTANTFKADQTVMDKDGLKVGDKVSVTATAVTAGKTSISDEGVKVGDKTYISADGLNANGQHITNVKAGEADTDAVNYGQLKDTNNRINGVENQVISNSNRINQLGSRVNKVGAGAAALAALHPMDFDPDDKLTFSAGYGNYAGENAAAIGAYYRPDEKVMFSVGGTVGNGENMVNAGISFALDRTNHVSNSRTALAREVIDLRGQLAVMGAKMAKMEKAFGMLDETKTKLFPDVPANHWAYEYIAKLAGNGYIEGYPDGNFGGDRLMTRYEFAAMLYRAIEKGAALEEKIIKEFEPELGRIRVDRISGEDGDRDKIERVRVNDTKGERDHYGNKLAK